MFGVDLPAFPRPALLLIVKRLSSFCQMRTYGMTNGLVPLFEEMPACLFSY